MIWDELKNAGSYRCLGERFARAFDYLGSTDFTTIPEGRHEIDGQDIVAMVQSYQTKPVYQGKWEAHRRYADVQYIVSGRERMGIAPLSSMSVQVPYAEAKDLEFFTGRGQMLTVTAGQFTVFLPQDVHMPSIQVDGPARVLKVVMKVRW